MEHKLKIVLRRSLAGRPAYQRRTVEALGLKKINSIVEKKNTQPIRGMINQVKHLISVEEI